MAKPKTDSLALPPELFHAIAVLINRLVFLSNQECGIEPIDLLILWHCRHFGKLGPDGRTVILRQDLTLMLKERFQYSDSMTSKRVKKLQEGGFVQRPMITDKERLELFGDTGDTRVVVLEQAGQEKLEEFKDIIRSRFSDWLSKQSRTTKLAVKAAKPVVEKFARWLVKRYEPHRDEVLYPQEI